MTPPKKAARHSPQAMALSIALHTLLLLAAHHHHFRPTPAPPAASAYTIQLTTIPPAPPQKAQPEPQQPTQKATSTVPTPPPPPTVPPDDPPTEQPNPPAEAPPTLDERGLYNTQQHGPAGAQLDLPGWTWDDVPQPQDDTQESGKIIFEIKIDDQGEIIAISTLEKTITPLVAEIYKEALTQLTFSKTSSESTYAPITVGKITFIIRAK